MKAYLQKLCSDTDSTLVARHLVREYLQAFMIDSEQSENLNKDSLLKLI